MGRAKSQWIEDQERGWSAPKKFVCRRCVEDVYLKKVIWSNRTDNQCDYCGGRGKAAAVEVILEPISRALHSEFNDFESAGCPYDKDFEVSTISTSDALQSIPLNCHEDLLNDIENAFDNGQWVEAPGGSWMGSHAHQELGWSWENFVRVVKHNTRFHFGADDENSTIGHGELTVSGFLPALGRIVEKQCLLRSISPGVKLYRVRSRATDAEWALDASQLGAPPPEKTPAGRMNPAGISYLYMALEAATAVAETVGRPPASVVTAAWTVNRKLNVLDLTDLPEVPSIFDDSQRSKREVLIFLYDFIGDIVQPVQKDGSEHIDYVPTQVVSEFFAQAFKPLGESHQRIDGLKYPSAVLPGGTNLVLFPTRGYSPQRFDQVTFVDAKTHTFDSWAALMKYLIVK